MFIPGIWEQGELFTLLYLFFTSGCNIFTQRSVLNFNNISPIFGKKPAKGIGYTYPVSGDFKGSNPISTFFRREIVYPEGTGTHTPCKSFKPFPLKPLSTTLAVKFNASNKFFQQVNMLLVVFNLISHIFTQFKKVAEKFVLKKFG